MTKEVLVSISGLQTVVSDMESNSDEPIEVVRPGTYYFKNGKHYIFMEEMAEGMQGVTKTQIKWKDNDWLEISKKGLSNVHMLFERNKKNRCFYETPFGMLNLGVFMSTMQVEEQTDSIRIRAEYSLDVNYEPLIDCVVRIWVCPKDVKDFSLNDRMTF